MLEKETPPAFTSILEPKSASEETQGGRRDMVATSVGYVPFGHGRHTCPGRFFAAAEMKTMMAHVLLTYDVKLEREGELPKPSWFGAIRIPDPKARVLFRQRVV